MCPTNISNAVKFYLICIFIELYSLSVCGWVDRINNDNSAYKVSKVIFGLKLIIPRRRSIKKVK